MQSQREEYGVIYAMNIHILSGKGASPPAPSAEGVRHGTRGVRSAGQEEEGVTLRAEKKPPGGRSSYGPAAGAGVWV